MSYNFRNSPQERLEEAISFLEVEFPKSNVFYNFEDNSAYYVCLTIENCKHSSERIKNVSEGLKEIVHSFHGVDVYEEGADIFIHA